MSGRKFAIIDPAAGISGDMLLGALIDAGAAPEWLHGLPARLGIPDVTVGIETVMRCGIRATKIVVRSPDGSIETPADVGPDEHGHAHDHVQSGHERPQHALPAHGHTDAGHEHHPHAPHRHVAELIGLIERASLSGRTRDLAAQAFRLVAEAEGRVHGLPPEKVSLHEVGALDALVDIVGGIEGFEQLGIEAVYSLPVSLGSGWVRAAHGILPVPAPATALLVEGLEVLSGGPVVGEATTPTGAALLRVLSRGTPPARWRPVRTAWGAGTRNPAAYPNALRLTLAEGAAEAASVVLLATDVDDLSPEYLEPMREALSAAGALDVQIWPTQMKKGRIGFRIEAIAPPDRADAVADAVFRHSTTAGLRRLSGERITLARAEWTLDTESGGTVRMKTVEAPGGSRAKPEYDDVLAESRRTGRPAHDLAREFYEQAGRLARASAHETAGRTIAPKESE
jgi:pyridinium-3,5-bisthiocarboxylic acid mononucleotide nickel chelatase